MFIIKHKNIFFIFSALLVAAAIFAMSFWGLNPGIEFTGGTIIEVAYPAGSPTLAELSGEFTAIGMPNALIQPATTPSGDGFIIRTHPLGEDERQTLLNALSFGGTQSVVEERYSHVGPSIGAELKKKAWMAIAMVLFAIVLFVWFAFRRVSGEVLTRVKTRIRGWHYGVIAIIALAHDILIPTGVFALLGSLFVDAQMDVLFVTALLAILGYSVNDTIVVFDRVRENLRRNEEKNLQEDFEETVGKSLSQSYARSINTSLTTLFVLGALFFLGGSATHYFTLVLAVGVIAGTYSSLFLAAPLLSLIGKGK